ncbi:MAG: hypothetical protein CMJ85_14155, partial [Planctomycetes bacterium]|nr:hypothetical protein [Planctomycetota bacterium]
MNQPKDIAMNTASDTRRLSRLLALGLILALGVLAAVTMLPSAPGVRDHAEADTEFTEAAVPLAFPPSAPSGRTALAATRHAGVYHAPVGSRFVFDLDYRIGIDMSATKGNDTAPTSGQKLHGRGQLELTVAARRPGEILVMAQLPDLTLEAAGSNLDETAAGWRAPLFVKMTEDGRPLGHAFDAQHDVGARNMLRGLLCLLAFVVPPDAGDQWEVESTDDTGTFVAQYRLLTASGAHTMALQRTRDRYLTMTRFPDETPEHTLGGRACARIDDRLGWLSHADVDESCDVVIPIVHDTNAFLSVRTKISLELTGADRVAVEGLVQENPWDLPFVAVFTAIQSDNGDAGRIASLTRKLDGVTLHGLLSELQAVLAAGEASRAKALSICVKLAGLLTIKPEAIGTLLDLIRANGIGVDVAMYCHAALAQAGTPAAQTALTAILADPSVPMVIRRSAAGAIYDIEAPTDSVFDVLSAQVRDMHALNEVSGNSLLAFGVLAGRSDARLGDGRTGLDRLLAMETSARNAGATEAWLDALGNSRQPAILDRVMPYLDDSDARVRQRAVVALRGIDTPGAAAAIEHRAMHDADLQVRIVHGPVLDGSGGAR